MKILGFDPGETSGYALLEGNSLWQYGIVQGIRETWRLLDEIKPDIVVCESFSLYKHRSEAQTGSNFPTVEIIGIIKLYCELQKTELVMQTAAVGKSIWSDAKLRKFGYYTTNKHSRDAVRHTLHHVKMHVTLKDRWND